MEKPPCIPQVRLTPEESEAVDKAMTAYRKRTGRNITQTGATKDGLRLFCEREQVEYPPQPDKRRGQKRAASEPRGADQR